MKKSDLVVSDLDLHVENVVEILHQTELDFVEFQKDQNFNDFSSENDSEDENNIKMEIMCDPLDIKPDISDDEYSEEFLSENDVECVVLEENNGAHTKNLENLSENEKIDFGINFDEDYKYNLENDEEYLEIIKSEKTSTPIFEQIFVQNSEPYFEKISTANEEMKSEIDIFENSEELGTTSGLVGKKLGTKSGLLGTNLGQLETTSGSSTSRNRETILGQLLEQNLKPNTVFVKNTEKNNNIWIVKNNRNLEQNGTNFLRNSSEKTVEENREENFVPEGKKSLQTQNDNQNIDQEQIFSKEQNIYKEHLGEQNFPREQIFGEQHFGEQNFEQNFPRENIFTEQNFEEPSLEQNFVLVQNPKTKEQILLQNSSNTKFDEISIQNLDPNFERILVRNKYGKEQIFVRRPNPNYIKENLCYQHMEDEVHKCEVCGKCFRRKSTLYLHKQTHSGQKPYECDICNKKFGFKHNLTKHKRNIHIGIRPYFCEFCSKGFKQKTDLDKHRLLHTGERPYSCVFCYRSFTQNSNLAKHMTIHTGQKLFVCHICSKGFNQRSHLVQHMSNLHLNNIQPSSDVVWTGQTSENGYPVIHGNEKNPIHD